MHLSAEPSLTLRVRHRPISMTRLLIETERSPSQSSQQLYLATDFSRDTKLSPQWLRPLSLQVLPADACTGGVVEESRPPQLVVDVDEMPRQLTNWMMCGEVGRQRLAIARRAAVQVPAGCSITKDAHPRLPLQHPPRQVSVTSAMTMRIRTDMDRY